MARFGSASVTAAALAAPPPDDNELLAAVGSVSDARPKNWVTILRSVQHWRTRDCPVCNCQFGPHLCTLDPNRSLTVMHQAASQYTLGANYVRHFLHQWSPARIEGERKALLAAIGGEFGEVSHLPYPDLMLFMAKATWRMLLSLLRQTRRPCLCRQRHAITSCSSPSP